MLSYERGEIINIYRKRKASTIVVEKEIVQGEINNEQQIEFLYEGDNQSYSNSEDLRLNETYDYSSYESLASSDGEQDEDNDLYISQLEHVINKLNELDIEHIQWKNKSDYKSFNVNDKILKTLKNKYANNNKVIVEEPLFLGANISLNDFNKRFRKLMSDSNVTQKQAQETFQLFVDTQPNDSLLINMNNTNKKTSDFGEVKKDSYSLLLFDSCVCGCTVYEGDNSCLSKCKYCLLKRYTDESKRYSIASLNYRPFTTIICELLETETFLTSLKVKNSDSNKEGLYVDILDGEYSKELMSQMNANHKLKVDRNIINESTIEVSLLLGFGYDGAQVFHYSTSNFWPMLLSILNLPPALRKTMGVGTFMISLFTSIGNSTCEEFILHKCLVEELQMLNEGIIQEINGKIYHIQAKLCIFLLDSKAVESVTKTKGANSKTGCCFCRLCRG